MLIDVKGVAQGYRTSELTGREVLNDAKQEIGEIDDIVSATARTPIASW
jgi:hypothetical protein